MAADAGGHARSAPGSQKNLLAQTLGFTPGTSLIENFGSTDSRFKPPATVLNDYPGPGAYVPLNTQVQEASSRWSWGTALARGPPEKESPGPGAYGTEQHPNGILTTMRRRWPGVASKSAFGSNDERPLNKSHDNKVPAPGKYNTDDASYFSSGQTGARSPYVAAARARTGSRLQRDVDLKVGSVFSSRMAAHGSLAPSAASTSQPGPGTHSPVTDTIANRYEHQQHKLQLRSDGGLLTSFDTTASRFKLNKNAPEVFVPGPGAHAVGRWSGVLTTTRRPQRSADPHLGFLSNSERFGGGGREGMERDAVVQYLANSATIGQPTHAQRAISQVAQRR